MRLTINRTPTDQRVDQVVVIRPHLLSLEANAGGELVAIRIGGGQSTGWVALELARYIANRLLVDRTDTAEFPPDCSAEQCSETPSRHCCQANGWENGRWT